MRSLRAGTSPAPTMITNAGGFCETLLVRMEVKRQTSTVTLYVVPHCPLCADARAWLRRNAVEFDERDVASDFGALRAMYRLTKQNLVPVLESTGRALVRPSDAELREFLL